MTDGSNGVTSVQSLALKAKSENSYPQCHSTFTFVMVSVSNLVVTTCHLTRLYQGENGHWAFTRNK